MRSGCSTSFFGDCDTLGTGGAEFESIPIRAVRRSDPLIQGNLFHFTLVRVGEVYGSLGIAAVARLDSRHTGARGGIICAT